MNSKQRVEIVLGGGIPDRVPVCLHNFLMAAKEAGIPLERYLSDPVATARAHLHALELYGHDCLLIDLDTTLLAEAMGAVRDHTPGATGHIAGAAISSRGDVGKLRVVDPERDTNAGPNTASNVVVTDPVPSGTVFASASANKGSFTTLPAVGGTGTVTWSVGSLLGSSNAVAQLQVTVALKGKTAISNAATVTSDTADPNSANNTATTSTSTKGK